MILAPKVRPRSRSQAERNTELQDLRRAISTHRQLKSIPQQRTLDPCDLNDTLKRMKLEQSYRAQVRSRSISHRTIVRAETPSTHITVTEIQRSQDASTDATTIHSMAMQNILLRKLLRKPEEIYKKLVVQKPEVAASYPVSHSQSIVEVQSTSILQKENSLEAAIHVNLASSGQLEPLASANQQSLELLAPSISSMGRTEALPSVASSGNGPVRLSMAITQKMDDLLMMRLKQYAEMQERATVTPTKGQADDFDEFLNRQQQRDELEIIKHENIEHKMDSLQKLIKSRAQKEQDEVHLQNSTPSINQERQWNLRQDRQLSIKQTASPIKRIAQMYFPQFRFMAIYKSRIVVWVVKFSMLNTGIAWVYFKDELSHLQYCLMLDINAQFGASPEYISVWPIVSRLWMGKISNTSHIRRALKRTHMPSISQTSFLISQTKISNKLKLADLESFGQVSLIMQTMLATQFISFRKLNGTILVPRDSKLPTQFLTMLRKQISRIICKQMVSLGPQVEFNLQFLLNQQLVKINSRFTMDPLVSVLAVRLRDIVEGAKLQQFQANFEAYAFVSISLRQVVPNVIKQFTRQWRNISFNPSAVSMQISITLLPKRQTLQPAPIQLPLDLVIPILSHQQSLLLSIALDRNITADHYVQFRQFVGQYIKLNVDSMHLQYRKTAQNSLKQRIISQQQQAESQFSVTILEIKKKGYLTKKPQSRVISNLFKDRFFEITNGIMNEQSRVQIRTLLKYNPSRCYSSYIQNFRQRIINRQHQ